MCPWGGTTRIPQIWLVKGVGKAEGSNVLSGNVRMTVGLFATILEKSKSVPRRRQTLAEKERLNWDAYADE